MGGIIKEKISVLGRGEIARSLFDICKQMGIAATLLESADGLGPQLRDTDIIVQFVEDGLEVPLLKESDFIGKYKVWLVEVFDQSVTKAASKVGYPQRVVGFSLYKLFPEKKFVEVISGEMTTNDAVAVARGFFEKLQFTVVISRDHPGYVLNRIVASMINESYRNSDGRENEQGNSGNNDRSEPENGKAAVYL